MLLFIFLSTIMVRAQIPDATIRPDLWVDLGQDSILNCRIIGTDTVPGDFISASYQFGMIYDSTARTNYTFTEAKRNGIRIPLQHWRRHHLVHMDADVMSYNSRTAVFPLLAGDTLSLYRELDWYTLATREQSPTNYYALDTLAYSVELVRASDGAVLAMLDSIGIMPNPTPGAPQIHGTRPIMANVMFRVPATLAGDSAFIGIRLYAHGGGQYNFIRYDGETIALSRRLMRPYWIDYLRVYGFGLGVVKPSTDYLTHTSAGGGTLEVVHSNGRNATIKFNAPEGGTATVAVYDAAGQLVFYPYAGPTPESNTTVSYRFPKSGAYIVVLLHDGKLTASTKVSITK